jgi:hypothetical protein
MPLNQHCLSRSGVAGPTIEDPAETFEELGDRSDLRHLVSQGITRHLNVPNLLEQFRKDTDRNGARD